MASSAWSSELEVLPGSEICLNDLGGTTLREIYYSTHCGGYDFSVLHSLPPPFPL